MKCISVLLLAVAMSLSLIAADVAGTWKGSMESQSGNIETTITFRPGSELAGRVRADQFDAPIENARLDGDKISFEINIQYGKVTYQGTVDGDQMKLTVIGTQGNKYSLDCKRQK